MLYILTFTRVWRLPMARVSLTMRKDFRTKIIDVACQSLYRAGVTMDST